MDRVQDKNMLKTQRHKFGPSLRLVKQREFDHVFKAGRRVKIKGLTILRMDNALGHPRLGISIGRSFGNAVERNRMKRRLREAFRLGQHELGHCDFICVPYRRALEHSVPELKSILGKVNESPGPITSGQ
jgi:ribonuclease P protein component